VQWCAVVCRGVVDWCQVVSMATKSSYFTTTQAEELLAMFANDPTEHLQVRSPKAHAGSCAHQYPIVA
jgi:hypothetical protein